MDQDRVKVKPGKKAPTGGVLSTRFHKILRSFARPPASPRTHAEGVKMLKC